MKTSQLMLGDLVMVEGEPYKVIGIDNYNSCNVVLDMGKKWYDEETCDVSFVEPIPLTAEILEKNGFGRDPLYYEHNDGYDFFLGDVRSVHVGPLQYVHELQHALRLCGLDYIADNFKI